MQLESIAQGGNKFVKQLMDYALETIENNPTINTLQQDSTSQA